MEISTGVLFCYQPVNQFLDMVTTEQPKVWGMWQMGILLGREKRRRTVCIFGGLILFL